MIKTGIFGGSFNPIHKGHIAIAETICNKKLVDELWIMVSPQNPLKSKKELFDDSFRLQLAKIATKNFPQMQVSDFEYHLPRPSYTYHTLKELRKKYPDREFVLIIGADNWENFTKWYKYDSLLRENNFIIYPRKGFTVDSKDLPSNVHYLEMPLYDISSTEIRNKITKKEDISNLVDPEIEKEIRTFLAKQPRK